MTETPQNMVKVLEHTSYKKKKKKKSEEWHKTFRMLFFFSLQTPKLPVNKKNKKKLKYV